MLLFSLVIEQFHRWGIRFLAERLHQLVSFPIRLSLGFTAKFHQQPAATFGQERDVLRVDALLLHVAYQDVVETFQTCRLTHSSISGTWSPARYTSG